MGSYSDNRRREGLEPVLRLSEYEERLFRVLAQEDVNYIYQFKQFLTEATEHIAVQLVPLYQRIILAENVSDIVDLTSHPRFLVRTAAVQKIDFIEGRLLRREKIVLNPKRWPQNGWNHPRFRANGSIEP